MKVLLSIKPEFVDKIFQGTKRVEFRRVLFRRTDVSCVIVYASSPVQRVIGEFEIDEILSSSVEELWDATHTVAGISKQYFYEYFEGKPIANAIKIGRIKKYRTPQKLSRYNIQCAPQSFVYIEE